MATQSVLGYLFLLLLFISNKAFTSPVQIPQFSDGTLGTYITYFQEQGTKLSLEQAKYKFANESVKKSHNDSISLGIGVAPVWIAFTVNNTQLISTNYRLSIETPWLDRIDTWLVDRENKSRHIVGGDAFAFEQRPMPYRFYAFEHDFEPGLTKIYMRVESIGPMAIPVRLSGKQAAISRDIASGYEYGVLYGIMSALALYNLVLFIFIRQREYGLYSLYLIGFVLNSLSYTGQIHAIFTPDFGPYFQDWVDIFLMITYSVAGLHFARLLLDTKSYAPILDKSIIRITIIIPAGMLVGFVLNQLVFSMALAFILNCGFVILFILMGIFALKAQKPFAVIFLFSSVVAAICISISTLAVAGILVPYNDYTFKAIEVGMAFEAILLAVILARQFRMAKLDKVIAENYARTDALTNLNNRHGFKEMSLPIWQNIIREKRDVSVVILDIDSFKEINDTYGHSVGDETLKQIARCIEASGRKGDVSARWGGEEFIVFLPETSQSQAKMQAERLRNAIEQLTVATDEGRNLSVTASFGVSGSESFKFHKNTLEHIDLEVLVKQADKGLYLAKNGGKNRICIA